MRSIIILLLLSTPIFGAVEHLFEHGIDSFDLAEVGTGILIGQIEPARSGKWGYDDPNWSNFATTPAGVYGPSGSGMDAQHTLFFLGTNGMPELDGHATRVANLMIGNDDTYRGVAPAAQLHSLSPDVSEGDFTFVVGINRLATMQSGQVRTINMSFAVGLGEFESPDGNSHLTKFIDWSARRHDVLYVVGWGNYDSPEFRKPSDNYNGITVASSEDLGTTGYDRRYAVDVNATEGDAAGDRTSIDILAPGKHIRALGIDESSTSILRDGSSGRSNVN